MYLQSINVENFRNLASVAVELSSRVNIFYGDNGSGKTNLLEAIFVLCLGRSHRAANEAVLIKDGCDFYRIEGIVHSDDRTMELAVAYQRGSRKKATIDKVAVKLSELYGTFALVAAGPEDSDILSGSPSSRRGFLDIYLSQYSAAYLDNLISYQKVLVQKNAALKKQMDPAPFNELLVHAGAAIMKDRLEFLDKLGRDAIDYYRKISDGQNFGLEYRPSVKLSDGTREIEDIAAAFRESLAEFAQREQIMETSLVGIHRDDIHFTIDSLPARTHGSQGEWRTAAIALKLAVYHLIKERRGIHPVLLLDEIFAELDDTRCRGLMNAFEDFEQLFITTAATLPDFLKNGSRSYKIADGAIVEIS